MKTEITWIVRYVDKGVLLVRTFYTQEAALTFMESAAEGGVDVRSWAEVRIRDLPLPEGIRR